MEGGRWETQEDGGRNMRDRMATKRHERAQKKIYYLAEPPLTQRPATRFPIAGFLQRKLSTGIA
jgi:hypothetical protein